MKQAGPHTAPSVSFFIQASTTKIQANFLILSIGFLQPQCFLEHWLSASTRRWSNVQGAFCPNLCMPFGLWVRLTHPLVFEVQHLLKHAWVTQLLSQSHIVNEVQPISFYTIQFFPYTSSCQSISKLYQAGRIYRFKDFLS